MLLELLKHLDADRAYPEKELNGILGAIHPDFASLRRELIDYGFMTRSNGVYLVADAFPDPGPTVAPELPSDAAQRFRDATRA